MSHPPPLLDDLDPKYTEICSQRTVQSTDRGFFQELHDTVQQACPPKWLATTFAPLAAGDHEAAMRCLLLGAEGAAGGGGPGNQLRGILEHVQPVFKPKDARVSVQRRREGERLGERGDWSGALTMLSQAVLRAPPKAADLQSDGGLHLALALWTRAGALLKLGNGPGALADLQYAVECGLPAKQHGAYYLRLAKANAMSGDKAKALICLALGDKLCNDAETRRGLAKLKANIDSYEPKPETTPKEPTLAAGSNPQLPHASALLDVRHDTATTSASAGTTNITGAGQYAVARSAIRTGDVLLVEPPYATCLLVDCHGTHCLHCMRPLRPPTTVPYGCDSCSAVAFCSPRCKQLACSTYHRYECQFGDLLIGSGMSVLCYIALRAITQSPSVAEAIRQGGATVQALCGHTGERSAVDRFRRAVMAGFLLSILQKSGFFGEQPRKGEKKSTSPLGKDELQVAAILLGLLEVLQFNAHEIYETRLGRQHRVVGSKPAYIGVGLYRTGAYFNHDCHPAVSRHFVGTALVLTATRPLAAGQMVGENYGPVFTKRTRAERQRELRSRYWFRCGCASCAEDWPVLVKLENRPRLRCPTVGCAERHAFPVDAGKMVQCRKCRVAVSLMAPVQTVRACEELYRRAAQLMDKEKTLDAIEVFAEGIDLFYTVAHPPHKDTHLAQESLRTCLADQGSVVQWTNASTSGGK